MDNSKKNLKEKLINNHGLSQMETIWLLDSLCFEKANLNDLDYKIQQQLNSYVQVMSAPTLAKDLLIQHISLLSKNKGYTTLKMWQEKSMKSEQVLLL